MVRGTTHTRALLCKVMYVIHDDESVVFSLQSSEEENKKTHTHTHTYRKQRGASSDLLLLCFVFLFVACCCYCNKVGFFSFLCVGFLELTMK
jgi:hypothetical protein